MSVSRTITESKVILLPRTCYFWIPSRPLHLPLHGGDQGRRRCEPFRGLADTREPVGGPPASDTVLTLIGYCS